MATNAEKTKLFVYRSDPNNPKGITLAEMMQVLGYYKRDKNGKRNLGMIYTNAEFNKWSLCKPFRCNKTSFADNNERDKERKKVHQGLLMPTPQNTPNISSQHIYGNTYLGYLAYSAAVMKTAPNWEYLEPRGILTYNEPFRFFDMDGYNHRAAKPFSAFASVLDGGNATLIDPTTNQITINRFKNNAIRCGIIMENGAEIALGDLMQNDGNLNYYFTTEIYKSGKAGPFYDFAPDKLYVAKERITDVNVNNGSTYIDIPLDPANDSSSYEVVLGVNEFDNVESGVPESRGNGFLAPWEGNERPFLFSIRQDYYAVLDFRHLDGYYFPIGSSKVDSFGLKDYSSSAYHRTNSDIIGISLKMRRRAENYYITGSKSYSVPSGAKSYSFAMLDQKNNKMVVGTLSDATMTTETTHAVIAKAAAGEDEWQTIYLKFNNFLAAGTSIDFGVLKVSSDGGQTYMEIGEIPKESIEAGCDGSSVRLYIQRA